MASRAMDLGDVGVRFEMGGGCPLDVARAWTRLKGLVALHEKVPT
jgi:hypothetical protein